MAKKLFLTLALSLSYFLLYAQVLKPISWHTAIKPKEVKVGETVTLNFQADIAEGWYLYATNFDPDLGPMVTTFLFESNSTYQLLGDVVSVDPKKKYDDLWEGEYTYFSKKAHFTQKLKVLHSDFHAQVAVVYQVCTEVNGKCIPLEDEFTFDDVVVTKGESLAVLDREVGIKKVGDSSLLGFMLYAFSLGLIAIFTPCVFPMIPLTVSFFSKGNQSGGFKGKIRATLYGLSIVFIYTTFGLVIAPVAGPAFANEISTHWLPNILFFIVFFAFALSFFGMFDIVLPSNLVNRADAASEKSKGFIAIFFMALTLVLVSFSCTGPLVGSLLVESAGGEFTKPVAGMFAFGMAFGLPFSLFAFFPSLMSKMPQSGGWLNAVKVTLGFIELALAFKFLSIVDQVYHLGILDREVNIAIWIAIATFMVLYYLNKIKLPHDSPSDNISVFRLLLALLCFSFVVYLIPGMFGAPLKALSGYLPPQTSHNYDLGAIIREETGNSRRTDKSNHTKIKYGNRFKLPHGLKGYFDLKQALVAAKAQNKPIFIDFTGHACVNCRKMEEYIWSNPEVLSRLKKDYIVVALYVDDRQKLPREDWKLSVYDNQWKKTIGKINADYQISKFNNNAQPFYTLITAEEKLLVAPRAYDLDIGGFIAFLDSGLSAFQKL